MALKLSIEWLVLVGLVLTGAYLILNLLAPTGTGSGMNWEELVIPEQDSFPAVFRIRDNPKDYYQKTSPYCFIQGTMSSIRASASSGQPATCACFLGWHGATCDIPNMLHATNGSVVRRPGKSRRLVYVLPLNETLKATLRRIHYLQDVVDVFVYGNLTGVNATQFRRFYEKSQWQFGHQMLFVWKLSGSSSADELQRNLVSTAFRRLSEVRLDDLVALSRHRETPDRDLLLYLKLHDGYPEQVFLKYDKRKMSGSVRPDVCTVGFLLQCCQFDLFGLKGYAKRSNTTSAMWVLE